MYKPESTRFQEQFAFAGLWFLGMPVILQLVSSIYFLNLATTGLNPTAGFMAVFLLPWLSPWLRRLSLRIPTLAPAMLFAGAACAVLLWQPGPVARVLLCMPALVFLQMVLLRISNTTEFATGIIAGCTLYGLYLAAGGTYRPALIADIPVLSCFCVAWLVALAKSGILQREPPPSFTPDGGSGSGILVAALPGFWIFAQVQFFQFPGTIQAWTSLKLPEIATLLLSVALLSLYEPTARRIRGIPRIVLFLASGAAALDLSVWQLLPAVSLCVFLTGLLEALKALATHRSTGGSSLSYGLPATLIMLLSFAWIFTITYDQAKLLGSEFFRDKAPLLLFLVALAAVLPVLFHRTGNAGNRTSPAMIALLLMAGAAGIAFTFRAAGPLAAPGAKLRVATYNIYQGFDPGGYDSRQGILHFMNVEQPHLLGLQESDTTRPSSQCGNIVEWLTRRSGMHSFFGPHPGRGSFGVSTLATLPVLESSVAELSSIGEQVHIVRTRHRLGDREFDFLGTHFGLSDEDHIRQTEETIRLVQSMPGPKILVGDFNLDPKFELDRKLLQKLVADTGLIDVLPPDGPPTHTDAGRIDTIFVSPEFEVLHAMVLRHVTASDHFPVVAELRLRP